MVSWWASKLACQGGFEDQQADSEKADQSAQNGRFSRAESVPSPRGDSRLGEKASLEADPELALESSDVSLTYQVPKGPCHADNQRDRLCSYTMRPGPEAPVELCMEKKPAPDRGSQRTGACSSSLPKRARQAMLPRQSPPRCVSCGCLRAASTASRSTRRPSSCRLWPTRARQAPRLWSPSPPGLMCPCWPSCSCAPALVAMCSPSSCAIPPGLRSTPTR